MPGLDATGPLGQGPMSGWGEGRCQGDVDQPPRAYVGRGRGVYQPRGGFLSRFGRGFRRGWGRRGRGFGLEGSFTARRRAFSAPPADTAGTELEALKHQAEAYAQQTARIEARIAELEASPQTSPQTSPQASPQASPQTSS